MTLDKSTLRPGTGGLPGPKYLRCLSIIRGNGTNGQEDSLPFCDSQCQTRIYGSERNGEHCPAVSLPVWLIHGATRARRKIHAVSGHCRIMFSVLADKIETIARYRSPRLTGTVCSAHPLSTETSTPVYAPEEFQEGHFHHHTRGVSSSPCLADWSGLLCSRGGDVSALPRLVANA